MKGFSVVELLLYLAILLTIGFTIYKGIRDYNDTPIYKCIEGYKYKKHATDKVYYPLTTKFGPVVCN